MNEHEWEAWETARAAVLKARRDLGYANAALGPDDRPERIGPDCGTLAEYRSGCDCLACRAANATMKREWHAARRAS